MEEDKNDKEEESAPIKFTFLGSQDCPVQGDEEEIEYSMSFRIPKIENLEKCTQLKVSLYTNSHNNYLYLETWPSQESN